MTINTTINMSRMSGPDCAVTVCDLINTHSQTHSKRPPHIIFSLLYCLILSADRYPTRDHTPYIYTYQIYDVLDINIVRSCGEQGRGGGEGDKQNMAPLPVLRRAKKNGFWGEREVGVGIPLVKIVMIYIYICIYV